MKGRPKYEALISCGQHLAALHGLPEAPEQTMRAKIRDILIGRRNFEAYREGILMRQELRDVLMAHMLTLIAVSAGAHEPDYCEDIDLIREFDIALFGCSGANGENE